MASDPLENESMLGVLIVLFLVVVSTIYVFAQQQHQQQQHQRGPNAGPQGVQGVGGTHAPGVQLAANAVSTSGLSEKQLRLHRSLPSRYGARAITICVDALVRNKSDGTGIAWVSDDAPCVLADLLLVADVYLLCKLESEDQQVRERIQQFLTSSDAALAAFEASGATTKKRALKPHKVLFCTTSVGKIAFVRQIEPQVHVEVEPSVVRDLEKHVPRIVHVVPSLDSTPPPGMHHVTENFATYFDLLGAM